MKTAIVLAAVLLGGCAPPMIKHYEGKPVIVSVAPAIVGLQPSRITKFAVSFDAASASVKPAGVNGFNVLVGTADGMSPADWAVNVDQYRPLYESALLKALNRPCTVTGAAPLPAFFAFNFTYQCSSNASRN